MKTKKDIHLREDERFVDELRNENTRCPKCGGILVSKFGPGITLTFCVEDNCNYEEETETRQSKCRFARTFAGKCECIVNGLDDDITIVSRETCENCDKYKSRYIEYPISINKIENHKITTEDFGHECGALCVVKPCDKKYNEKSYIGIYIGDLPTNIITSFDEEQRILTNRTMNNPAIFVPELKKIVYGYESWWKEIKSPDDFKEITTEDIENQWYMKLLKSWK